MQVKMKKHYQLPKKSFTVTFQVKFQVKYGWILLQTCRVFNCNKLLNFEALGVWKLEYN